MRLFIIWSRVGGIIASRINLSCFDNTNEALTFTWAAIRLRRLPYLVGFCVKYYSCIARALRARINDERRLFISAEVLAYYVLINATCCHFEWKLCIYALFFAEKLGGTIDLVNDVCVGRIRHLSGIELWLGNRGDKLSKVGLRKEISVEYLIYR